LNRHTDSEPANAPAHVLFERIQPKLKEGVTVARTFANYDVAVDASDLPAGVTLLRIV
jgi:CRISPR-associated protein Csd2